MVLKKTLASIFGLAFLSFVVVQYNDPDPALWMVIYGIASLLCFMAGFGRINPKLLWAAALLFMVGGIWMWPVKYEGVSIGGGDINNIEEARESLGLFLCTLAFAGIALAERLHLRRALRLQQLQKARWANL